MNQKRQLQPTISLVMPFFNEANAIERSLSMLLPFLSKFPQSWELILVNDGSQDDSESLIEEFIDKHFPEQKERIQIVSYRPNRGRGFAMRKGFEQVRGQYVITCEFDLSYGLSMIPEIYQKLVVSDYDIVIASPYATKGKTVNIPFTRAVLSRMGNKLLKSAFGGTISTVSGMTRGYKKSSLDRLFLTEDGKEIHLEILYKSMALGFKITEVPATLSWSEERARRVGSFKALPLIKTHLLISFMQRPFLLLGTMTVILLLLGLAAGIYAFIHSVHGEKMGQRPITLFAVLVTLFSSQVGCFLFLSKMIEHLQKSVFHVQSQLNELHREKKG